MQLIGLTALAAASASLVAASGSLHPIPRGHSGMQRHRRNWVDDVVSKERELLAKGQALAEAWLGLDKPNDGFGSGSGADDDDDDSSSDSDEDEDSDSNPAHYVVSNTTTSNSGSKNGLAWPNGPWMNIQPYKKTMSWLYSWDAVPATGQPNAADFVPAGISFFPMLWSNTNKRVADWQKYVLNDRNNARNSAKVAMGPNEVNQVGQGIMSPTEACGLFAKYIIPLKDESGWQIIGPSTNGADSGIEWMKDFQDECPDVWSKIDYTSVHWYGTDPARGIQYFQKWHQEFDKPIYITETACMNYDGTASPTLEQQYNFIKKITDWVKKTDYIKGLSFYGVMKDINIVQSARLSTPSGDPTDLFQFWINNS